MPRWFFARTPALRRRGTARPAHRRAAGQSLVELAIILPVVLTLVVGGLDLARAYERQLKLQSAVRNATEQVTRDIHIPTGQDAATQARRWICLALDLPVTCTQVVVTATTFSTPASATSTTPTTVALTATYGFSMLVPYPLLTTAGGTITLRASSNYTFIRSLAP